MIKNRIFYSLVMIASILFFLINQSYYSFIFLALIILIPITLVVYLLALKGKIYCSIDNTYTVSEKGSKFIINISAENRSIFSVVSACLTIYDCNTFSLLDRCQYITLTLPAKSMRNFELTKDFSYCGTYLIKVDSMAVFDPIRLFKINILLSGSIDVTIFPHVHNLNCNIKESRIAEDGSSFSLYRSGDDPSETFGVRCYYHGDRINRVNWKISSKVDNLMVREYGQPVSELCFLALELYMPDNDNKNIENVDIILEAFISVSSFLAENHISHKTGWFDCKEKIFRIMVIQSETDVLEMAEIIMQGSIYKGNAYTAINYSDIYCKGDFPKAIYFTASLDENIDYSSFADSTIYISNDVNEDLLNIPAFSIKLDNMEEVLSALSL